MSFSERTQAILLLTAYFSKPKKGEITPLTLKEYGRFAHWLNEKSLSPEILLTGDHFKLLREWSDEKISLDRLTFLLKRGTALALASEKWQRGGLWVINRSEKDYPELLRQRLKNDCPPLLFGSGNHRLLNQKGIAVVGSRNVSNHDLTVSRKLGELAAKVGVSIVSGGARGVDEATMIGALEAGGTAVGVLANDLLRSTSSSKYRRYLMSNSLVLVSPFYPEAGFNVGNAMARNKYIYCISVAGIVVHSGKKGGTWSGALENLKHKWIPLWIKDTTDLQSGNHELIRRGGNLLPKSLEKLDLQSLFVDNNGQREFKENNIKNLKKENNESKIFEKKNVSIGVKEITTSGFSESENDYSSTINKNDNQKEIIELSLKERKNEKELISFYDLFILKMKECCNTVAKTSEELATEFEMNKTQLNKWLKCAVEEGKIKKMQKPVRYKWNKKNDNQMKFW